MNSSQQNAQKKILIVDDDPDVLAMLKLLLEELGYKVYRARSGPYALAMARKYRPDLMTLDILMPGMNGFSVCQKIKNDHELRDIKIVVLSAKGYAADERDMLALGADAYMFKPVDAEVLIGQIRRLIGRGTS